MSCAFHDSDGVRCKRNAYPGSSLCIFHFRSDVPIGEPVGPVLGFQAAFDQLIAASDGHWRGFAFPSGTHWPDNIKFAVDARQSRFGRLEINRTEFSDAVDFSDSSFDDGVIFRSAEFVGVTRFDRCRFNGATDFLNVKFSKAASFYRAEFGANTVIRASFGQRATFNEAIFRDAVTFSGWRNVSLTVGGVVATSSAVAVTINAGGTRKVGKAEPLRAAAVLIRSSIVGIYRSLHRYLRDAAHGVRERIKAYRRRLARTDVASQQFRVFEKEGDLENVIFMKPEQTLFSGVDLSTVYLRGTNLRGVRLQGVRWWQPALRRNGLRDELLIAKSADGAFRFENLPVLEDLCRNVRVALEESRSFEVASDFYVAELEARRAALPLFRRHLLSIPAAYWAVSRYGTSVATAARMLLWLMILHAAVTVVLAVQSFGADWMTVLADAVRRSVQVLVFQVSSFHWDTDARGQFWADALLRVAGLIQITMLVLAFRSRIKRH